jgi:hypothetical protein
LWCLLSHCILFYSHPFYPDGGLGSKARYVYCPMDRSAVFCAKILFRGKLRYLFLEMC